MMLRSLTIVLALGLALSGCKEKTAPTAPGATRSKNPLSARALIKPGSAAELRLKQRLKLDGTSGALGALMMPTPTGLLTAAAWQGNKGGDPSVLTLGTDGTFTWQTKAMTYDGRWTYQEKGKGLFLSAPGLKGNYRVKDLTATKLTLVHARTRVELPFTRPAGK